MLAIVGILFIGAIISLFEIPSLVKKNGGVRSLFISFCFQQV